MSVAENLQITSIINAFVAEQKNAVTPNESMKAKTLSNLTIKSKYKRFEPINEQYTVYSIQYIVNSMYQHIGRIRRAEKGTSALYVEK